MPDRHKGKVISKEGGKQSASGFQHFQSEIPFGKRIDFHFLGYLYIFQKIIYQLLCTFRPVEKGIDFEIQVKASHIHIGCPN